MASLLTRCGAEPTLAPSMREVPLESNTAALGLAQRLVAGEYDGALLILLTGVGTRTLLEAAVTAVDRRSLVDALNRLTVVVRGPKPLPVLKEWGIHLDLRAPEPNTWREVVTILQNEHVPLQDRRVIVQEYGAPTPELYDWLRDQGATVEPIPVYNWDLPTDVGPLEAAIRRAANGEFDLLMFTSAQQVRNVLDVASRLGLEQSFRNASANSLVASIGPTTTETLRELGLPEPFEPSHGKMGHLVTEGLAWARERLGIAQ
jgi:uroporphyrinogen-III synthase